MIFSPGESGKSLASGRRTSLLDSLLVVPAFLLIGCGESPDTAPPDAARADAPTRSIVDVAVAGEHTLAEFRGVTELETVQGGVLQIEAGPRGLTIDGSNTLTADIRADNGIIHVITEVLTPGGG